MKKSSFRQRMVAGIGANAFGQVSTIGMQVLSLPLFLSYWDITTYGSWLILSAIPFYLSMADLGMVTTAGNRMAMAIGKGDHPKAQNVFQSALLFMMLFCGVLGISFLVAAFFLFPAPKLVAPAEYKLVISALAGTVIISLFGGLADSIFRATNRYSQGTMLTNLARLGEWAGGLLGLVLVGSFLAVAVGAFLARAIGFLVIATMAVKGETRIGWGIRYATTGEVRVMLKPALLFLLFPLAFALSMQGLTLLVGHLLGAAEVAKITIYRTLARVTVQVVGIFSHALSPEFSNLYGSSDFSKIKVIYYRAKLWGYLLAVFVSAAVYTVSPWVLDTWTRKAVDFEPVFMFVMLAATAASGAGHVPRILLMSVNNHMLLALLMVAASILLLLIAWITGTIWGLLGVGCAILGIELLSTIVTVWLTHRFLNTIASKPIL